VDGPYRRELRETRRRWIGSSNQRIFFLTDRYGADDPCWLQANTVEIRLQEGIVSVNGFPIRGVELRKR
jgi:anaerobic ribonucleoside-triphosphate reductase activating protein